MASVLRRLRNKDPLDVWSDQFQQQVTRRTSDLIWQRVWREYERRKQRTRFAKCYVENPLDWLKAVMVIGRASIVTGLPDTGKTNLFYVLAELALDDGWAIGTNINSDDPRIHFFQNKHELEAFLAIPQPKLLGFDDAAIYVSSRRSGTKVAEFFRSLHVAARKPVPDDPDIPGAHLVWLTQSPDIINIDFRQRFTAWQLHKPSVELKDAAEIAYKKGRVPIELKRVVWAYFLVRDKDGNTTKRLVWWTDQFPKTELEYDTMALGEFFLDTKEETKIKIEPVYGSLKVKLESKEVREDLFEALFKHLSQYADAHLVQLFLDWLAGDSLRTIHGQTGIPASSLSDKFTELRENGLGYAFEDAYAELYPDYKRGGKNTEEPDFIDTKNKRVISTKCYCDPKINLKTAVNAIAKSEKALLNQGYTLQLHLFEAFSRILYVYECTNVRGGP